MPLIPDWFKSRPPSAGFLRRSLRQRIAGVRICTFVPVKQVNCVPLEGLSAFGSEYVVAEREAPERAARAASCAEWTAKLVVLKYYNISN